MEHFTGQRQRTEPRIAPADVGRAAASAGPSVTSAREHGSYQAEADREGCVLPSSHSAVIGERGAAANAAPCNAADAEALPFNGTLAFDAGDGGPVRPSLARFDRRAADDPHIRARWSMLQIRTALAGPRLLGSCPRLLPEFMEHRRRTTQTLAQRAQAIESEDRASADHVGLRRRLLSRLLAAPGRLSGRGRPGAGRQVSARGSARRPNGRVVAELTTISARARGERDRRSAGARRRRPRRAPTDRLSAWWASDLLVLPESRSHARCSFRVQMPRWPLGRVVADHRGVGGRPWQLKACRSVELRASRRVRRSGRRRRHRRTGGPW